MAWNPAWVKVEMIPIIDDQSSHCRERKSSIELFFFHLNWPNNTRITQHIQIFLGTCVFSTEKRDSPWPHGPHTHLNAATIRNAEMEFLPFQALAGWGRVGFTKPPGFTWCCRPHRNLWDSNQVHPKTSDWDVMIWRKGQQQKPTKANNNNNKPKLWGVLKDNFQFMNYLMNMPREDSWASIFNFSCRISTLWYWETI